MIAAAHHSETREPLVVYRLLYGDFGWWVRPHAMFFGEIEFQGRRQPRFVLVSPASVPAGNSGGP